MVKQKNKKYPEETEKQLSHPVAMHNHSLNLFFGD